MVVSALSCYFPPAFPGTERTRPFRDLLLPQRHRLGVLVLGVSVPVAVLVVVAVALGLGGGGGGGRGGGGRLPVVAVDDVHGRVFGFQLGHPLPPVLLAALLQGGKPGI